MCFTVSFEGEAIKAVKEHLKVNKDLKMNGEFNEIYYLVSGFSHPKLPVIKYDSVDVSEWGLIPNFATNIERANELANMTLNARSDTIHEKPSFRNYIKTNRCVLPLDGFYEWQHIDKRKQPYYIYPSDETVFYIGCIYNIWVNRQTGEMRDTFSIITTDANPMMEKIHNTKKRMPLILPKNALQTWVDPTTNISDINNLMQPYTSDLMSAYTITQNAGNARLNRNTPEIKARVV
ncbi:MAG: SOS response-associated peptidase [Fermentimonas sp.]|nr:SOS response-associated peptidase [Fermentimonas sp.]